MHLIFAVILSLALFLITLCFYFQWQKALKNCSNEDIPFELVSQEYRKEAVYRWITNCCAFILLVPVAIYLMFFVTDVFSFLVRAGGSVFIAALALFLLKLVFKIKIWSLLAQDSKPLTCVALALLGFFLSILFFCIVAILMEPELRVVFTEQLIDKVRGGK